MVTQFRGIGELRSGKADFERKKKLSIVLKSSLYDGLKSIADRNGTSVAEVIRCTCQALVDSEKK